MFVFYTYFYISISKRTLYNYQNMNRHNFLGNNLYTHQSKFPNKSLYNQMNRLYHIHKNNYRYNLLGLIQLHGLKGEN